MKYILYDYCRILIQVDVDALDGKGYTALQIACDSVIRENTLEIVKLLLDKKVIFAPCLRKYVFLFRIWIFL